MQLDLVKMVAVSSSAVQDGILWWYGKQTPMNHRVMMDDMDYVGIASEGNAIDFGDLTVARNGLGEVSSSTRGIFFGGGNSPSTAINDVNTINYIEISPLWKCT